MCVVICTYSRTYIHTYLHLCIHAQLNTYILTCLLTYIHTYIPTYLHTYIHTYLHVVGICMYVCMHVCLYVHMYIYAHIHVQYYQACMVLSCPTQGCKTRRFWVIPRSSESPLCSRKATPSWGRIFCGLMVGIIVSFAGVNSSMEIRTPLCIQSPYTSYTPNPQS